MTEYHIHNWILISAHYFNLIHRIRLFAKYTKKEHLTSGFLFWSIKILSNFFSVLVMPVYTSSSIPETMWG